MLVITRGYKGTSYIKMEDFSGYSHDYGNPMTMAISMAWPGRGGFHLVPGMDHEHCVSARLSSLKRPPKKGPGKKNTIF